MRKKKESLLLRLLNYFGFYTKQQYLNMDIEKLVREISNATLKADLRIKEKYINDLETMLEVE